MNVSLFALVCSAILLWSGVSYADPSPSHTKTAISVQARTGYRVLGGKNSTGGLTLGAAGHLIAPIAGDSNESLALYAGASIEAIGINGDEDMFYWLGILAGAEAGAYYRNGWYYGGVGVVLPYGQLPFVNDWGWPMRFWGLFPGLDIKPIGARADDFNIAVSIKPMYTHVWSCQHCVSWAVGVSGGFR
jgi:hypothetical protein